MCKPKTIATKNNFFIKSSIFVLVPWEFPEGPLVVPDVRTFRGHLVDVPGTLRAGWIVVEYLQCPSILDNVKQHPWKKRYANMQVPGSKMPQRP